MDIKDSDLSLLKMLARDYKNIPEANTEMINLKAIQNLPKGTEYFYSDIHGEYEAFDHLLRSASGTIKRKIDECFPELEESERRQLATIIYYPSEKLAYLTNRRKQARNSTEIPLRGCLLFFRMYPLNTPVRM